MHQAAQFPGTTLEDSVQVDDGRTLASESLQPIGNLTSSIIPEEGTPS
jgi:hypothetical protein